MKRSIIKIMWLPAVIMVAAAVPCIDAACGAWEASGLKRAALVVRGSDLEEFELAVRRAGEAGAKGQILFPPSVILCLLPAGTGRGDIPGTDVFFDSGELAGAPVDGPDAAAARAFLDDHRIEASPEADHGERCPDLLLEIDPAVFPARRPAMAASGAPADLPDRNFYQNSEFLIGSVLINIVFPESYGTIEEWTDDEISGAVRDISIGLATIQEQFHWVDIRFYVNYRNFMRLPVTDEPITTNAYDGTNATWKIEALSAVGYLSGEFPYDLNATHRLNNETRAEFGTDWVFTAFIVDASNHYDPESIYPYPECWGGAGYISMAYLGGPFLEIPYPACKLGYGRKFSHLFVHEMSHIFWALDEYPGSPFTCSSTAGYLNWVNGNSFHVPLGGSGPCGAGIHCIMAGVWPDPSLVICPWTTGQMGLADENFNSVPDIYDVPPEVEMLDLSHATGDTICDGSFLACLKVFNRGIPNLNPKQIFYGPRIDYRPWLVKGEMRINNGLWEDISPAVRPWDSSDESVWILLREGLDPGNNTIFLKFRNCVGLSVEYNINVVSVGLKYYMAFAEAEEDQIVIEWKTAKEVFGADFEIFREDLSAGNVPELVKVVDGDSVDGSGINSNVYKWTDWDVLPGRDYCYRIRGSFDLYVGGELLPYEAVSRDILVTSVIPVVDGLVSNLMPNPFGMSGTSFSVDVPNAYFSPDDDFSGSRDIQRTHSLADLKTPLDISVFNIKGEKVRGLFSMALFGGYRTFDWDGRDDRGLEVAPGVYFIKIDVGRAHQVRKAVIIR